MVIDEDINIIAEDIKNKGIKNSKIVITGATGLLGSLMVKVFVRANEKYGLNNKIYALARNVDKANDIFYGFKNENLVIVKNNITEPININEDVDYVFHFAAITASKDMVQYPVEVIESTILGLINVLSFSYEHKAKSVAYMSSMEVFGVADQNKRLKETDIGKIDLTSVRSCYPESKRLAENLCKSFAAEYGLNVKVARLTQTFGAGAKYEDNRVFGMIARSVVENKDIILMSKGDLARDYCYTVDAINAILYITLYGESGEVYNVANENTQTSVFDMCKMVAKEIANNKISVRIEIPEDVASKGFSPACVTMLDTSKIQELGWEPRYNLKEMYARLIQSLEDITKQRKI